MADRHKLYKEVLDRAPFGTLLIAYGVCIDANRMALQILNCQRSDIVGAALSEAQSHQPASIEQLKQVVDKLQRDQLSGILWRSENILKEDEVVVSLGPVETADDVLSITLYPLPALAHMVVKEFSTVPVVNSDKPKLVKPVVAPIEAESEAELENNLEDTLAGTLEGSLEGSLEDKSEKPSAPAVSATKQSERDRYETLSGLPVSPRLIHSIGDYLDNPQSDTACGTLLLIDLDHFNSINESLGKALGNQILERAAETIEGLCTDNMEMDQVAGDSFLVLIKNIAENAEQARQASLAIANEIRCILTRPFFTENGEVSVTASVGISVLYAGSYYASPDVIGTAEQAVQQAESAMFEAKRRGRDNVVLFDSQITRQARQRINMQSNLRKAVANQEFDLHVQPQVSTHSGDVVGGEVLLRWMHSGQAQRSPADFIPVLESSGMIVDVGLWVIRTSCEYLRNMLDQGLWTPDMQMAVNISPKQFHDPQLIKSLEHSLKSYDIRPDMLTLEVTETLLIDDFESVVDKMKKIRNMGTRFAIDDFGSGYSSMIYLKRLPLDILKIDREFITHLNSDKETLGLVEAIMMVAHHYGLDVVAEGVEKREVLEILRSLGCEKYQGAHFSMPVSLDKFQRLLVA
ncbi:bifunctional diguanylate cyclase/phosphodiesterase [Porticoccaceae bacterium]|jgi:diguanylate cyclase (GGDEF)-like protein|nr:bifunctional diguanylate cyclase/phosphodiesterase [Porticoccaceae bacterium]